MIYFIQQNSNGPIKIGYTKNNVKDRLYSLQMASPLPLTLIGTIHGDKDKEKEIHNKFKECHIRGEWFKFSPKIISFIFIALAKDKASFSIKKNDGFDLKVHLHEIEMDIIQKALEICGNNRSKAAKFLNITRPTLHSKIKLLEIFKTR